MNIKILYDNEAAEGFRSGWGFSALIDNETLFDTGEDAGALLANMHAFDIAPQRIRQVVLSHAHEDHVGGIAALAQCPEVRVYLPAGASDVVRDLSAILDRRAEVIEVTKFTDIDTNEFVTARLGIRKKEISLCARTTSGLFLITGCAHPGLGKIMARVSDFGKIHAVIGGFHGFNKLRALADVHVIVPCHCTRKKQELLDMYPGHTRRGFAGMEMDLGEPD